MNYTQLTQAQRYQIAVLKHASKMMITPFMSLYYMRPPKK